MFVPRSLLRQLYTFGSLHNVEQGVQFSVKNRLLAARLTGLRSLRIDRREIPLEAVRLQHNGRDRAASEVSGESPLEFSLMDTLRVQAHGEPLDPGTHEVELDFDCTPFGRILLDVQDAIAEAWDPRAHIPRSEDDDYGKETIRARQRFVQDFAGLELRHLPQYSLDPRTVAGNCENFTGVAQVPIGLAGPLRVEGEHARGEFLIPLATTEGTLVASYSRGMQALNLSGGVRCTVVGDGMQRAPVFAFPDARRGRAFVEWVDASMEHIRAAAEATSRVAKLDGIEPFLTGKFVYLRFRFLTGDAAGQNMVSRATLAACGWILEHFPGIESFCLDSNLASDKKFSFVNVLLGRGKRVTAEATIAREVLEERLRVKPEALVRHAGAFALGTFLAGANSNGLHAANAIAAMFIATGQDVANLAESSAAAFYAELTPHSDLYVSVTLPSLIVGTYGGGTGLATQRECLELLGCYGTGKVRKLAEIVAGVVLAGEISLAAAIVAGEWVASHERYGRNR
jgi:hydroxymethylglutaryl-CoA reductase (NADPH)